MDPAPPASRREVVDQIRRSLAAALDGGGPRTLVLTAGPGSGKTHTLRNLIDGLDVATRWATADELSWRHPYAVAAGLLGLPLPTPVPADVDALLDDTADALCAHNPHLLVVDDAHNADAGSLEFLGRLAAAAPHLPLVLVIARRQLPERALLSRLVARDSVADWHLPPMDDDELAALAGEVVGAPPDSQLAALLARSGGNPMHARTILEHLRAHDALVTSGGRAGVDTEVAAEPSSSLDAAIHEQLTLLDPNSRALVHKLAVWGGRAPLGELAALDGSTAAKLMGPAQTALDSGVIVVDDTGELVFAHDVYAEVAYAGLNPALRSVLHTEIARRHRERGDAQLVAHHLLAAGAHGATARAAVTAAQSELAHAPAVAVDLLDTAARSLPAADAPGPHLELDLATALARTGQLARSAQVASEGLAKADQLDTIARLHRILLFTLLAQGEVRRVQDLIASTLTLPVDDDTRAVLADVRAYAGLLGGAEPVPPQPFLPGGPTTVSELVTEGLRRFLVGDGPGGLEMTLEASRREAANDAGRELATSAEIWPSFIEQYVHGPDAAADLLTRATRLRTDRGAAWMTAYHDFVSGGIATARGELDDAAAAFDAGLERAAAADLGWTSMAEGTRAMIDVFRGEFPAALTRLDAFAAAGLPFQFGLPATTHAQVLLLEAQRKLRPATVTAQGCWSRTIGLGLHGWLPSLAVDFARLAHRTRDDAFAAEIAAGLAAVPRPLPQARRGAVALAGALCSGNSGDVLTAAVDCAQAAHGYGDAIGEAEGWEESACAAATLGDKSAAREHAHSALLLTQGMGATALSSRITSRLRPLGLRLDPGAVRDRPRSGWDSLTPTESTIAELIAAGLNGAEIGEKLYISQRTVQTHVSHTLAKLDLRTRVEIAAAVTRRNARRSNPSPT